MPGAIRIRCCLCESFAPPTNKSQRCQQQTIMLFEAVIPSVKVLAEGNDSEQIVNNVALRFRRQRDGKFTFELEVGAKILFNQDNKIVEEISQKAAATRRERRQ